MKKLFYSAKKSLRILLLSGVLILEKIPQALAQNAATSKAKETGAQSGQAVQQLLNILWEKIDNWIAAIIVMLVSVFVARMIRTYAIDKISEHLDEEHQDALSLIGRATYIAVLALGFTIALKVAGIDITTIIAAIGFGIGFALQDLIMNFIAGIFILVSRHFSIGDFIQIKDILGQVKEIQSRSTVLQALDGTKIIVPNKDLFSNIITSYTTNPFRRIDVPVGVEYSTDLKLAVETSLKTMRENINVAREPEPSVLLDQFADSSINLILRFWVESKSNWLNIRSSIIMELKKNFDAVGINIPFPIRTVYMNQAEQKLERDLSKAMEDSGMTAKSAQNGELLAAAITSSGQQIEVPFSRQSAEVANNNIGQATEPAAQVETPAQSSAQKPEEESDSSDSGAAFLQEIKK